MTRPRRSSAPSPSPRNTCCFFHKASFRRQVNQKLPISETRIHSHLSGCFLLRQPFAGNEFPVPKRGFIFRKREFILALRPQMKYHAWGPGMNSWFQKSVAKQHTPKSSIPNPPSSITFTQPVRCWSFAFSFALASFLFLWRERNEEQA